MGKCGPTRLPHGRTNRLSLGPGWRQSDTLDHLVLLLSVALVHRYALPLHQSVRAHPGAQLCRILATTDPTLRPSTTRLLGPAAAKAHHSLRSQTRKHIAMRGSQSRCPRHRLWLFLSGGRESVHVHSISLLPQSRGHPGEFLQPRHRHVVTRVHSCRTVDRISHFPRRERARATGMHHGDFRSSRPTSGGTLYSEEALLR